MEVAEALLLGSPGTLNISLENTDLRQHRTWFFQKPKFMSAHLINTCALSGEECAWFGGSGGAATAILKAVLRGITLLYPQWTEAQATESHCALTRFIVSHVALKSDCRRPASRIASFHERICDLEFS
jgi:hypothetical protein